MLGSDCRGLLVVCLVVVSFFSSKASRWSIFMSQNWPQCLRMNIIGARIYLHSTHASSFHKFIFFNFQQIFLLSTDLPFSSRFIFLSQVHSRSTKFPTLHKPIFVLRFHKFLHTCLFLTTLTLPCEFYLCSIFGLFSEIGSISPSRTSSTELTRPHRVSISSQTRPCL